MSESSNDKVDSLRRLLILLLALVALLAIGLLVFALWNNRYDPVLTSLVLRNFPVIIGLPFSGMAAFVVVALFRQSEAPIEFEGIGFRFKGAAGEIVLWNASFAIVIGAIHLLWIT